VRSFAGTTNGQAAVAVRAADGGTASNVPAGSIGGIEGRLAGVLLVTNYAAASGGTTRSLVTLTTKDTTAPIAGMRRRLVLTETATLNQKYAKSPVRSTVTAQLVSTDVRRFVQNGEQRARITVTVRAEMAYLHAEDIQAQARARLRSAASAAHRRLIAGSERVTVRPLAAARIGSVVLRVTGTTQPIVDTSNLQTQLAGTSLAEARQVLARSGALVGWHATVSTSPNWSGRMPIIARLIRIEVGQR
jgi:hypothetical protein